MKYKVCPDCGASLDLGEKCDCTKEKGLPHANENSPKEDARSSSMPSIPQNSPKSKENPLRELRIRTNTPAKIIVGVVQALYPKYDKTLQSKCENGNEYGVALLPDAWEAVLAACDPEQLEKAKRKRDGYHKLTCKIACRLEDNDYAQLIKYVKADGFETMQAWLTFTVKQYLRSKAEKEGRNVRHTESHQGTDRVLPQA